MNRPAEWPPATNRRWPWPITLSAYDRTGAVRPSELAELRSYVRLYKENYRHRVHQFYGALQRLVRPLRDVTNLMGPNDQLRAGTINVMLRQIYERRRTYWGWSQDEWLETLDPTVWHRPIYMAFAYLLTGFTNFHAPRGRRFRQVTFARKIFGREAVEAAVKHVQTRLSEWGHAAVMVELHVPRTVCEALLVNRSPFLEDLTLEVLESLREKDLAANVHRSLVALSEVLASDGIIGNSLAATKIRGSGYGRDILVSVSPDWVKWCQRWRGTSTRGRRTLRVGTTGCSMSDDGLHASIRRPHLRRGGRPSWLPSVSPLSIEWESASGRSERTRSVLRDWANPSQPVLSPRAWAS